jgi:hypothetical protein
MFLSSQTENSLLSQGKPQVTACWISTQRHE